MKKSLFTLACVLGAAMSGAANGQTTTSYEDGPDGVKYQVTRQIVPTSNPSTEYQAREQKVYRPQITTEYQSYSQTYITPVTQYQYVPHLRNWWNPFGQAYWTHDLQPVTSWVARPATVQIPVARTNWVEETHTTQVPVTTYRTARTEYVTKRPVSVAPTGSNLSPAGTTGTAVASRPISVGGQQYQSDLPRTASPWATTDANRR